MKLLGRAGLIAIAGFGAAASVALAEAPQTVDGISNYKRLSPDLAAAGKPSPEAVSRLKALGFKTVIDLRTEKEGTAEEKAAVESQGLRYVSVPVTPATLSLDDVKAVAGLLDDPAAGPVLLHCAGSVRVGAVYGAVQALKGKSLAEAEAAGRAAGLTNGPMVEAMRRVAAEAGAK
jgi:uncharacterized protein (TIGR01244 family)